MTEHITADKAMDQLKGLIDSEEPVTQDAVEKIVSSLSVVDGKVDADTTTFLYTKDVSAPSNCDELRYIGHTEVFNLDVVMR